MQSNWQEDFMYPVKHCRKLLQKYTGYFNTIFKGEMVDFCYAISTRKDDKYMYVGTIPRSTELYLEMEAYRDSPFMTSYDNVFPGSVFVWPDSNPDVRNNNSFRRKVEIETGARDLFTYVEKKPEYYQIIGWCFKKPAKNISLQEEQIIVMEDCINNFKLINTCLEQFYAELTPMVKEKNLLRINARELKGDNYEQQLIINEHHKNINEETFMEELNIEIEHI